jgi:hypothetical protein
MILNLRFRGGEDTCCGVWYNGMWQPFSSKTSATSHPTTWCHNPEDLYMKHTIMLETKKCMLLMQQKWLIMCFLIVVMHVVPSVEGITSTTTKTNLCYFENVNRLNIFITFYIT